MAVSTSAAVPFTVTSSGEFTTAGGLDGNGSPKSTLGTVGPNPLANSDSVSPGVAGFPPVTGVELPAWQDQRLTICGHDLRADHREPRYSNCRGASSRARRHLSSTFRPTGSLLLVRVSLRRAGTHGRKIRSVSVIAGPLSPPARMSFRLHCPRLGGNRVSC
jgi:hypothetical protein